MRSTPREFRDESLRGIWAAVPVPWDDDERVDVRRLEHLIGVYKAAGIAGVYTTGTDGEFHLMELPAFDQLVQVFSEIVQAHSMPAQIGVTWLNTEGVLDRIQIAREYGVSAVQFALPFWQPLNPLETVAFVREICGEFPDTAFIHYNTQLSGRLLSGSDYEGLIDSAPNLVGTKQTGGSIRNLVDLVTRAPELHHFVVDPDIMPGILLGAKGVYSAIVNINAGWMREWWDECERGDWTAVGRRKILIDRLAADARRLMPHLTAEPSWAKLYTRCGVDPEMPLRVRSPYAFASEDDVREFTALLRKSYPALLK